MIAFGKAQGAELIIKLVNEKTALNPAKNKATNLLANISNLFKEPEN